MFPLYTVAIIDYYKQSNYGVVISKCKKQTNFFNPSVLSIQRNSDKLVIKAMFDGIIEVCSAEDCTIKECLNAFQSFGLIKAKLIEAVFENAEYNDVLDIRLSEVKNIYNYINRPTISTQHGVKGEGHQSVVFVAADSYSTPNVRMYDFFNLWAHNNFSLTEFEELYYEYLKIISDVYRRIGKKTSELNSEDFKNGDTIKNILDESAAAVLKKYKDNSLFRFLLKSDFEEYLKRHSVTAAKNTFKITKIEGILTAYKLFYVGCSRARKNLIVIVDKNKVSNYEEQFIKKAEWAGFQIEKNISE